MSVDPGAYFQAVMALALVLGLIMGAGWLARRYGFGAMAPRQGSRRRLAVTEAAAVDGKRRLVLIRRDDVEHLVLIGGGQDLLIETGIPAPRFTLPTAQGESQPQEGTA